MIDLLGGILSHVWDVFLDMAPYLLFGFLMAGLLSVLISQETVRRHLGGRGLWPVVKAAIFGVPLPLCSCSVIPVTASLRKHGASRGASTAFLISTPQTGVDSIMVTFSLLGPLFAVFRPLAAFVSGIAGGALVVAAERNGGAGETEADCEEECCAPGERGRFARVLRFAFVTLPADIGKPLFIGIIVAGVISGVVPEDYFTGVLGTGIGAMLVMMLLGVPLYVCATASVPIAAALIAKGVTPGAALVFLMTGAATNAATITTVWKMMGARTAVIYLGTVMLTAFASGIVLDRIIAVSGVPALPAASWMLPYTVKLCAALVLVVILALPLLARAAGTAEEH